MKKLSFLLVLFFIGCSHQNIESPKKEVHLITPEEIEAKRLQKIKDSIHKEFLKRIDNLALKNIKKAPLYRDKNNFVIDPNTQLMWQDDKSVIRDKYYQEEAKSRCENLKFQNYKNWRLPKQSELYSIIDKRYYPAIKPIFKNVSIGKYWALEHTKYIDFTYGDRGEGHLGKAYDRCVRKSVVLRFKTKRDMSLYEAIKGNNDTFYVYHNKTGKFDKFVYFEYPFLELEGFTNSLFHLWYKPRKIKKPNDNIKIEKLNLPKPLQLVKSEYETQEMFEERKKRLQKQREEKIALLKKEYQKKLNEKKEKLKKELNKYLLQKEQVQEEQKYKDSIKQAKLKEFQKIAFNTIMGKFYLVKKSYNAEKEIMYAFLKSKRANYIALLEIKVPVMDSLDFVNNIDKIKIEPNFIFKDGKIILTSVKVSFHNKTYFTKVIKQNYEINDNRDSGLDYDTDSNTIMNQKFDL